VKGTRLGRLLAGILARWRPARQGRRETDAGRWGEQVAATWLARRGYDIIGRRVRSNRRDEIDLVARRGRAAAAYLRRAGYPAGCYRFDVVEVVGEPGAGEPVVRQIEDAFRFEPRYRFPVR